MSNSQQPRHNDGRGGGEQPRRRPPSASSAPPPPSPSPPLPGAVPLPTGPRSPPPSSSSSSYAALASGCPPPLLPPPPPSSSRSAPPSPRPPRPKRARTTATSSHHSHPNAPAKFKNAAASARIASSHPSPLRPDLLPPPSSGPSAEITTSNSGKGNYGLEPAATRTGTKRQRGGSGGIGIMGILRGDDGDGGDNENYDEEEEGEGTGGVGEDDNENDEDYNPTPYTAKKHAQSASAATASSSQQQQQQPARSSRTLGLSIGPVATNVGGEWPFSVIEAGPPAYPPKKYCDLTGLPAAYTDPKTGLHFCNADVFHMLRQLPPDTVGKYKSLRDPPHQHQQHRHIPTIPTSNNNSHTAAHHRDHESKSRQENTKTNSGQGSRHSHSHSRHCSDANPQHTAPVYESDLASRFTAQLLARKTRPASSVQPSDPSDITATLLAAFDASAPPCIPLLVYTQRLLKYGATEESLVLSLMYIDNLLRDYPDFILGDLNIHRLLLACVVVSLKHWEDVFYSNEFYSRVGGVTGLEMNDLEIAVLCLLKFPCSSVKRFHPFQNFADQNNTAGILSLASTKQ
ncbi:phosphate system cyclin PHO80 [Pelomyxa schiedti]|nr:phosphate system cyclin PHO80 [Pelomyxa schiedti]